MPNILLKYLKKKNIKNGMLYTFFSFFNNGISFLLILVLAAYLLPQEYGSLNLFTTFVTLFSIIIALSSSSYISVCFFKKSRTDLLKTIQSVFGITLVMLGIAYLFILLCSTQIERLVGIDLKYLCMGVAICLFTVFNNVNLDIWRLEEKPICYGLYSMSFAICNCAATLLFVVTFKEGWQGRVYAWFVVGLIYFLISILFLIKRKYLVISKPSLTFIKETLVYSLPLVPHSLSYFLKQGCDRFIINYYWDTAEVGVFSFAMNFASVINIIGTAFNSSNSVYLYKKLSEGYIMNKGTLTKQTRIMTVLFLVITLVTIIVTYSLIPIILPKYSPSIQFIPPLCVGALFQCLYLLWVNYLFYYKKTVGLMYITFTTCILQVILSILLTKVDVLYTAYTSMTISMLTMTFVMFYSKFTLRNESKIS